MKIILILPSRPFGVTTVKALLFPGGLDGDASEILTGLPELSRTEPLLKSNGIDECAVNSSVILYKQIVTQSF